MCYLGLFIRVSNLHGLRLLKNTLVGLGFTYIWEIQSNLVVTDIDWFKKLIKVRVEDQFKTRLTTRVFESEVCVVYRMFRPEVKLEDYLKVLPRYLALKN